VDVEHLDGGDVRAGQLETRADERPRGAEPPGGHGRDRGDLAKRIAHDLYVEGASTGGADLDLKSPEGDHGGLGRDEGLAQLGRDAGRQGGVGREREPLPEVLLADVALAQHDRGRAGELQHLGELGGRVAAGAQGLDQDRLGAVILDLLDRRASLGEGALIGAGGWHSGEGNRGGDREERGATKGDRAHHHAICP
jgi:hypothetical protein